MSTQMTTTTVQLPVALRDWADAQVQAGLYVDVSDYFRDLIRRDQRRNDALVDARKRWNAAPHAANG